MKIVIIVSSVKKQKIQIQITNPKDPLVLYLLDISEVEFHQIKTEQSILIDFQNFPSFMIKMINLCIGININSWNVSENNQSINYLKSHYFLRHIHFGDNNYY